MKRYLARTALTLTLTLSGLSGAQALWAADQPDPEQMKAAQRYWEVADYQGMLQQTAQRMSERIEPADRGRFLATFEILGQRLEGKIIEIMLKRFSTAELNALADFYGSAEGRSILAKMPHYTGEVKLVVQKELMDLMRQSAQTPAGPAPRAKDPAQTGQ